jgi:hypothetical protein
VSEIIEKDIIMNCENCEQPHDGTYGSGRFCSSKCARGFSTKAKRKEINEKVSQKLSGLGSRGGVPLKEFECENCREKYSRNTHISKYCSKRCSKLHRKVTNETRKKLSLYRTEYVQTHGGFCKYFKVKNLEGVEYVVQGTWELRVANKLNEIGEIFERGKFFHYDNHRRYTPDFYLPAHKLYIEVKGWWNNREKDKLQKVLDCNKIEIRMIESLEILKDFENGKLKIEDLNCPLS